MFSFADMSFFAQAGALALLGVAFLAFLAIVGLRLRRRGSARFWAAPGALALALLPAVLGAGVTALVFRETLGGIALVGSSGPAALAAGSAEALIPLLVGLVTVAALAFVGLLLTGIGSSRVRPGGSGGGLALLVAALLALSLSAGLVVLSVRMVTAFDPGLRDGPALLLRLNLSIVGSAVLAMLLFGLALFTALRAPRGASPLGVKLSALAAFPLCGLLALAGGWVIYGHVESYLTTSVTGVPPDDALPIRPSPESGREQGVAGGDGGSDAVRVGGSIKEPKKLKSVAPEYPEIARQARVQGVVILECTISPEGEITRVTVLRGIPLLDQAAVDAVKQWVYAPTLLNGEPVSVIMTVTVNFRLGPG